MAPRCSIAIPVHNKAALTRQCIDSILENPPQVSHEIVVVDDASTDNTPELVASYGDRVRGVRLDRNAGFATACNTAAAAGDEPLIVFLNNDTIALEGWLDALVAYVDAHPRAAVVGSKLLYPDDTVQHAGVVFGLSGDPLHIYAGCPPEHPAVCQSRRFQSVTAACMLIRREAFEQSGGFDTDYQNDLEDVDLCLRLGALGYEVHLCHESVLYHLESVSRGRRNRSRASATVYRRRWGGRVRSDELDYYLEDGLLDPLRISPAVVDGEGRRLLGQAELLQGRSHQLQQVLRETVRLGTYAKRAAAVTAGARAAEAPARGPIIGGGRRRSASRMRRELERHLRELHGELAASWGGDGETPAAAPEHGQAKQTTEEAGTGLSGYARIVARLPQTVRKVVPVGSIVLVVSKGDDRLVEIDGRRGWHFPRADDGRYAGYYPTDGEAAVAHLEDLRAKGAGFLVFPGTALWWLDYYPALKSHLEGRYGVVARDDTCLVFDVRDAGRNGHAEEAVSVTAQADGDNAALESEGGAVGTGAVVHTATAAAVTQAGSGRMTPDQYGGLVGQIHALVGSLVPPGANVLVVSRGDEALVDLEGRHGWHFPRDETGRYLGYHPATDHDAISHLEELRAKGGEFLVFPSSAFWWLDHYAGLAHHLGSRYRTVAKDDSCLIYELSEQLAVAVVSSLLPFGSHIVVASPIAADVHGFSAEFEAEALTLGEDPDAALSGLSEAVGRGAGYLVLPEPAFRWLDRHPETAARIREAHTLVIRQVHACELYRLKRFSSAFLSPADGGEAADALPPPVAEGDPHPVQPASPPRARGPLARLLWGRGERGDDADA